MTALLPTRVSHAPADLRHRRPLVPLALAGGVSAAAGTLLVALGIAVVGWYVADGGVHGIPSDGLRAGALMWLMGHGSGLTIGGAQVTAVPLGVTLVCAWAVWRLGHRVGDSVSGHGPDADGIADGERDWTVAIATATFALGYLAVVLATVRVAGDDATAPSGLRAALWVLILCGSIGGAAIATGSGRLAMWAATWPAGLKATVALAVRMTTSFFAVSLLWWLGALVLNGASALNVLSQLHTDAGDTAAYVVVTATLLPNATVFAGSYLLGPGFAVGTATVVSPTAVVVGALPLFPLLAALPDTGPTPSWTPYVMAIPPVVAGLTSARTLHRHPTLRWDEAAVRGSVGGALTALAVAVAAHVSGGSVGPGRMRHVGPQSLDVLVHALPALALGGLAGALWATWRHRRLSRQPSAD